MEAEALQEIKREWPEIEEHVLEEALRNSDWDVKRASELLRARFYKEDTGIAQEQSFWSAIVAPFVGTDEGPSNSAPSEWEQSLNVLAEGVGQLGLQLVQGVESIADAVGTIGDLIPDLIFGAEEDEYYDEEGHTNGRRNDSDGHVVVGGSRAAKVTKRGATPSGKIGTEDGGPIVGRRDSNEEDDWSEEEEDEDWTKED